VLRLVRLQLDLDAGVEGFQVAIDRL